MLSFAYPAWLFGLLLLPLLALIHWQQVQREHQAIEAFAREPLWAKMGLRPGTDARLWRGVLVLAAIACALVALAQPRWGAVGADGEASQQGSMVVLLDVSKSMLARDAGGDTRLKASQRTLEALLPQLAGWKIGVVAFAGEGQALVPLTTDHTAVETLLSRAQPGQAPGKGSSLEAGIKASLGLFGQPGRKVLLICSDGEELTGNARSMIPQLRQKNVQVLALGVGSKEGATVPGGADMWGNATPITYRGQQVVSKLQAESLQALAADTGGKYWHPESPLAVKQMAGALGAASPSATAPAPGTKAGQGFELFQVPLALGLLLVLADAAWGLAGRPRHEVRFSDQLKAQLGRRGRGRDQGRGGFWQRLGARLKRPAVGAVLVLVAFSQSGFSAPSWLPNWEAGRAYERGDWLGAGNKLRPALDADPENWRLHYNMGNIGYQNGNYYGAIANFQRAWELATDADRPTIGYNLGNAHFRQGEATGEPKSYERAITEYERVLADRPKDPDTLHNLNLARQRLKEAQQKQQQQGGQQGKPQSGGQGGQQGQAPVGVQHQKKPLPAMKNLPSEPEVDALLKALESDERQRQAEQGQEQGQDPQGAFGQNLLQQALGTLDMQKDW